MVQEQTENQGCVHVGILTYAYVCAELLRGESEPSPPSGAVRRANAAVAPGVALACFIVPPGPISPALWEREGQGVVSWHFSEWEGPPRGLPLSLT